jgi:hypothetical protein
VQESRFCKALRKHLPHDDGHYKQYERHQVDIVPGSLEVRQKGATLPLDMNCLGDLFVDAVEDTHGNDNL